MAILSVCDFPIVIETNTTATHFVPVLSFDGV